MNAAKLKAMQASPAHFRASLVIPSADGGRRFTEVVSDFQHRDFEAIDAGMVALSRGERPEPSRFWLERTKGASKDTDLAVSLLWLLAFTRRTVVCQVGAADRDQADELRKAAKSILRLNPWLGELVEIRATALLNPRTESIAGVIPADASGSHGARPDLVILNELTHIVGDEGKEFAETLLDNASKMPNGVVVVATNAGHLDTWQHTWRENARVGDRWYFSKVEEPAPWLDQRELEEARKRNSATRFARLWQGVWTADGGNALASVDIDAAVTLRAPPVARDDSLDYFGGLDLGISKDSSAFVIIGRERGGERLRLMHVQAWTPTAAEKVSLEKVEADLIAIDKAWKLQSLYADPWQSALLCERLRRVGVAVQELPFSPKNLGTMATATVQAFAERRLALWNDEILLRDLRRLRIIERGYGVRLEAARNSDGHADRATALALALAAAHEAIYTGGEPRISTFTEEELREVPTVAELMGSEHAELFDDDTRPGWQKILIGGKPLGG